MKAIESDAGYDPMPPMHHEFWMRHPDLIEAPVVEFMSLIYSKTIRKGHRSVRAVDGAGKVYTIDHVCEDRGWTHDWGTRVYNRTIQYGLVRPGRGGKDDFSPVSICLVGKPNPVITESDGDTNELVDSECTLRKLKTLLSESEYAQCEDLTPEDLERIAETEASEVEIDKVIDADAVFLARQLKAQRKRIRFEGYGIKPDPPATPRRKREPILKLELVAEGTPKDRSVHSEDVNGANTPTNGSVHSDVSLSVLPEGLLPELISTSSLRSASEIVDKAGEQASSSLRSSDSSGKPSGMTTTHSGPSIQSEAELIAEKTGLELKVAKQIIHGSRAKDRTTTAAEVLELIAIKNRQLQKRIRAGAIDNLPGLLITAIPDMIGGSSHQQIRAEIEQAERARAAGGTG